MSDAIATSIDRFHGVEPGPDVVAAALARQRERMLALFRGFDDDQWQTRSRCSEWTVHEIVRHLADVANMDNALQNGEGPRTAGGRIDPRTDPDQWLEASNGQTPPETVASFEAAMLAEQIAFDRRIREAGDECLPGPYGALHWAALGSHLFWDAWLHERDIVFPLGLSHDATVGEDRLAALYALTVASTVATFFGSTVSASIELTGTAPGIYEVTASSDGTRVAFARTNGEAELHAELGPLLDSLAGRGPDVADVLDGPSDVVGSLTLLRDFLVPAA